MLLYRQVLRTPVDIGEDVACAKRPVRLLGVRTRQEARAVLARLDGQPPLVALLLYGAGLRRLEALTLRLGDLDLNTGQLLVRHGTGGKDRVTVPSRTAVEPLRLNPEHVRVLHQRDLTAGGGSASLPGALAQKYPAAGRDWAWPWVLPASSRYQGIGRRASRAGTTCTSRPCNALCGPSCSGHTPRIGPAVTPPPALRHAAAGGRLPH